MGAAVGLNKLLLERGPVPHTLWFSHGYHRKTPRKDPKISADVLLCITRGESESPVHVVSLASSINQCSPLSLEGGAGNFSSPWSLVFTQAVVCVCLLLVCVPSTHTTPPAPQAPWPHCQGWFFSSCSSSDSSVKAPVCSEGVWVTSWLPSHLTQDQLDFPQMLCFIYWVVPAFLHPNQYGRGKRRKHMDSVWTTPSFHSLWCTPISTGFGSLLTLRVHPLVHAILGFFSFSPAAIVPSTIRKQKP